MTSQTPAATADNPGLRFGFVRGSSPSKWLKRWEAAGYAVPLIPSALPLDYFSTLQAAASETTDAAGAAETPELAEAAEILESGGVLLIRTENAVRPQEFNGQSLNAVQLYSEQLALLVAKDSEFSELEQITEPAEFELVQLLDHPWHHSSFPAATPWQESSWMPQSAPAIAELVASNLGAAILPLPLARHIAGKKQHRILPIAADLFTNPATEQRLLASAAQTGEQSVQLTSSGLVPTTVWVCWLAAHDSAVIQDFVGVLKGRRSGSSRDASTPQGAATQSANGSGKPSQQERTRSTGTRKTGKQRSSSNRSASTRAAKQRGAAAGRKAAGRRPRSTDRNAKRR